MNILNSYTSSPTFKSRCIQIRDAQWVCHKINTEMPHYSISKIKPMIVETANLAELILRMNGIKNAKTVMLKAENENVTLDHAICVFNRDGSTFSKIKRDTIVVDPWANKADFAGNMIKYYKNQCNKFFRIPKNKKIVFFQYKCNKLNETDLLKFRETYPNFIFNNSKRKFMNE